MTGLAPIVCRSCIRETRRLASTSLTAGRVQVTATTRGISSGPRLLNQAPSSSSITPNSSSPTPIQRIDTIPGPHNLAEPQLALQAPPTHPRTHGIHVASLHLTAHHPSILTQYTDFALHAAYSLGIPCSKPASLPIKRSLYTVIKSPFVHKKAQENFEKKTHKRLIKVWDADPEVIDKWLRYLKKYSLGGVGMKVQVFEWTEFGVGRKELDEALKPFNMDDMVANLMSEEVESGSTSTKGKSEEKKEGQTETEVSTTAKVTEKVEEVVNKITNAAPIKAAQQKIQKAVDQLTKDLKEDGKADKKAAAASKEEQEK